MDVERQVNSSLKHCIFGHGRKIKANGIANDRFSASLFQLSLAFIFC